jgi:hypothetical protein
MMEWGLRVLIFYCTAQHHPDVFAISISGLNVPNQATNPTINTAAANSTTTLRRNVFAATRY